MQDREDRRRTVLDELDRQIIDKLQEDGRRPYTEIAEKLTISEATVRKRVARLRRNGVLQIVAAVDPLALGYLRAEVSMRVRGPSLQKVVQKLQTVPEVSYIELILGTYDLSISLTCRNRNHLLLVLNDTIRGIPGIDDVEAFLVLEVAKDVYHWVP